ncbi:cytochrome P450 [Streptomyces beijiangensis]|uniref:cytochrome P450 family protein n=1 Tax=Streptomyces beijiangensis TaxID=163361 RepID=UPI00362409B0
MGCWRGRSPAAARPAGCWPPPPGLRDAYQHWPAFINGEIPPDWPLITWVASRSITNAYGQEHARLRKLLADGFTGRRVALMRPSVEKATADLLDRLAQVPRGEVVDLRAQFAHPLPARVICDLLGVPDRLRPAAGRLIDLVAYGAASPGTAGASAADWRRLATELVTEKQREPGEDVITDLITVRADDGSRLSEDELESTVLTLLRAGHLTVLELISNAVAALLIHPDQLHLVQEGQAGWDDVVEETLRADSPVEHLPLHYAVADMELDGVRIAQGDPILISFGAAGRDPDLHGATAEEFDVTRATKQHLAFGHGYHYCIGAPLGRMQATTALAALFTRFPSLSLAVPAADLEPTATFMLNGHRTLPVHLTGAP